MSTQAESREKLLFELYNQLWNSINTRLNLVWQSIGILVSAFAIFALTEKNLISIHYAVSIIIMLSSWFLAHIIDMSFWYNRNLVMIANIEKQFLSIDDVKLLYPYFTSHRKKNKMVHYLVIQTWLGIGISVLVTLIHFIQKIVPLFHNISKFEIESVIPYIVIVVSIILLLNFQCRRDKEYEDFIRDSPGKDITK